MKTLLIVAGVALLATSTPQPAGAEQNPSDWGTAQVLACQWMGGTPIVNEYRRGAGLDTVHVACRIKGLGGWPCWTSGDSDPECVAIPIENTESTSRWLANVSGEILPAVVSGSVVQIETSVAAYNAE